LRGRAARAWPECSRRSIGNQILVDAVAQSIERVQQGGRLGQSLADCKMLFSGSTLEMISVRKKAASSTATGAHRRRHRGGPGPQPQDRRGVRRAGDAVYDRRVIGTIFIGMLLPVLSMSEYIK